MNEIAQEVFKRADVIGAWASGKLDQTIDAATQQVIDLAMQSTRPAWAADGCPHKLLLWPGALVRL